MPSGRSDGRPALGAAIESCTQVIAARGAKTARHSLMTSDESQNARRSSSRHDQQRKNENGTMDADGSAGDSRAALERDEDCLPIEPRHWVPPSLRKWRVVARDLVKRREERLINPDVKGAP